MLDFLEDSDFGYKVGYLTTTSAMILTASWIAGGVVIAVGTLLEKEFPRGGRGLKKIGKVLSSPINTTASKISIGVRMGVGSLLPDGQGENISEIVEIQKNLPKPERVIQSTSINQVKAVPVSSERSGFFVYVQGLPKHIRYIIRSTGKGKFDKFYEYYLQFDESTRIRIADFLSKDTGKRRSVEEIIALIDEYLELGEDERGMVPEQKPILDIHDDARIPAVVRKRNRELMSLEKPM